MNNLYERPCREKDTVKLIRFIKDMHKQELLEGEDPDEIDLRIRFGVMEAQGLLEKSLAGARRMTAFAISVIEEVRKREKTSEDIRRLGNIINKEAVMEIAVITNENLTSMDAFMTKAIIHAINYADILFDTDVLYEDYRVE
ncbi:MAG: hypothetical protein LBQ65_09730 [Tannerellaceae bacterium]|jgi:hypothetical protein|nr:hypothetical protein [Tannerellaceae bacterium]